MAGTRSGKTNYKVGPEHQGRYAVANGTFASSGRKRKTDESRATRHQTAQDEERQKRTKIGNPSPPTPTKEELVSLPRPTRHSKPCCLHYGIDRPAREVLFPNHFFCGNCDAYVKAMIHGAKKLLIKKDSLRYICQAGHTNYIFPTTKKADRIHHSLFARLKPLEDDSSDDDDLEVMPPPVVAVAATRVVVAITATRGATAETSTPEAATPRQPLITPPPLRNPLQRKPTANLYKTKYEETVVRLNNVETRYNDLLHRHQTYLLKTNNTVDLTVRAINLPFVDGHHFDGSDVLDDSEKKQQKKVRAYVTMLMGEGFFDGHVRREIIKQVKLLMRETTYAPWRIARLMDKHGSKLSMESLDLFRTLETDGEKKYHRHTILCSSGSIKRVRTIIKNFANTSLPYDIDALPEDHGRGEVISFHTKTVVKLTVGACGLKEAAKERRICYPQSCDTTNITKNVSICMYGFKIVDRAARCPVSKRPLWLHVEAGEQTQSLIQSCENSIPTKLIIGKETKEMVRWALTDNFKDTELENASTVDDDSTILGEGFKPLLCPVDADKKMHWCGLDSGGAAKVVDQPCPCCAITSDDLAVPNANHCSRFCSQWETDGKLRGYPNWHCYHKPFIMPARIAILREECERLVQELGTLAENLVEYAEESKLDSSEDPTGQPQANARSDLVSIFFNYGQAVSTVRNVYMIAVASNLSLQNLPNYLIIEGDVRSFKECSN